MRPIISESVILCGSLRSLALSLVALSAWAAAESAPPNVVVILSDDLGYADLGCTGAQDITTPHVDALAASGVRCTTAYVTHSVCSPSRAGLITGRHQARWGHDSNWSDFGLPATETTLGGRLQARGYTTAVIGKWHLNTAIYSNPHDDELASVRGFDEVLLTRMNARYFGEEFLDSRGSQHFAALPDASVYTPTYCAERGAEFIRRHQGTPFCLYLPLNSVHENFYAPEHLEAPPQYLDRVAAIPDTRRRLMAAMVMGLDAAVGTIMDALEATGCAHHTLVIFTNDNGGSLHLGPQVSRNTPFRGGKGDFTEGGLRVPLVMRWPGHLPAGTTYDAPVSTLDIVPTVVAASGMAIPAAWQLDGVDLAPYLRGDMSTPPHAMLWWRRGTEGAVRAGDWKLAVGPAAQRHLYDVAHDPGEAQDLAGQQPERVAAMEAAWRAWEAGMARPQPIAPPAGFTAPWLSQAH